MPSPPRSPSPPARRRGLERPVRRRLAAWQSPAALAHAGLPAAEARATACHWFTLGAPAPWFDHLAWDLGPATLTPDRRRLAVLAATDTDTDTG
ncbi:DUF6183 family protein [Kitasatospora sp. CB02891]|uniref:DUF6183 family protein n=1 Tax=Kitasatospora sp. CB02891 TaxID=2020329 RepID=UPI000C27E53E|nr:DUF6183 family protein [Kitasatospora sp. CB02891]PJN29642.1 hypothetical protein CG736_03720 [Kitasatospora sp. CB02891]